MANIISGYGGLYQYPVTSMDTMKSSIYCIGNKDTNVLIMIPLVSEFLHTALSICKSMNYNHIYFIIPTLDVRCLSSVFNLWSMISSIGKDMHLFALDDFQSNLAKDTTFYNSFTWLHSGVEAHLMNYGVAEDYTFSITSFCGDNLQLTGDVLISDNQKHMLFSQYMPKEKLTYYATDEQQNLFDELHVPYIDTPYGGLTYHDVRLSISQKIISKLYVYGFHTTQSILDCIDSGGRVGRDAYYDIV